VSKLLHIYIITALALLSALVVGQFLIWSKLSDINRQELNFPLRWDKALWEISSDLNHIQRAIEHR